MEKLTLKFEEQKKTIEGNIDYIRKNLVKINSPIFIELIGTPKSGKTTLVKHLQALLNKNGIRIDKRQETAEYNPIENKDLEEYNIWMIMELMKELSEDMSNTETRIILYDRGILDRLPWIDSSVEDGSFPAKDAKVFKSLYDTEFVGKYQPLAYGFLTSPEISVQRKGREGRLVNKTNIARFNGHFKANEPFIKNASAGYTLFETDGYQDRLQQFILDVVQKVTTDTVELIGERIQRIDDRQK